MREFLFTFADRDHFDDIGAWRAGPENYTLRHLPRGLAAVPYLPGWTCHRNGLWTLCAPTVRDAVPQGWKIHISVTPESFGTLLPVVAEYCRSVKMPFKFLARHEYAWVINAKYAPRQLSGKGIVLYPAGEAESLSAAAELAGRLDGVDGPRILSDLRIRDTPVHVRYGAYRRRFCRDADGSIVHALDDPNGRLVPDRRSVPFRCPDFVEPPAAFVETPESTSDSLPPYRIEQALHFSNGGGVYLATDTERDRRVALKEARPFAAYDLLGVDAVGRAAREWAMMRRFADLPAVPEVYEQFVWQSHTFTAVEWIDGDTLQTWSTTNNPYIIRADHCADATQAELAEYCAKVSTIIRRVTAALESMWQRGYIFGDLHTGNVLVAPELEVRLIDFEAAVPIGDERSFAGAHGFSDPKQAGIDFDRHALRLLELACYIPLTRLITFDGAKFADLVAAAVRLFPLSDRWAERISDCAPAEPRGKEYGPDTAALPTAGPSPLHRRDVFVPWATRLTEGIRRRLDLARPDRVVPGDPSGFTMSPLCIATGAAGVLWSLIDTSDLDVPDLADAVVDWISAYRETTPHRLECGLYDSELGAGYVLSRAGYPDVARWLVETALDKDRSQLAPTLFDGLGGIYLAVSQLADEDIVSAGIADALGAELIDRAQRWLTALRAQEAPPSTAFGLLRGAAGAGLAVHRYGVRVGDRSAVELARELLEFEFAGYIRRKGGVLHFHESGRRSLSYLEIGSCGGALALAEAMAHEDWSIPGISLPDLVTAMSAELVATTELFRGRSGFIAGLATLRDNGSLPQRAVGLLDRQLSQLQLHQVQRTPEEICFAGAGNVKISSDFQTGSAGVLTAVAYATGRRTSWLPGIF
ncbi:class III lanthionine synthetase LanKC [Nocardia sp. XZ_19_369]|uniref:class III lanthionine synthetase LanKC n=1 Tax=Nocardia sp. XZ_19_369 TaxID=2769487 RepID=UPI00188FF558|nr:class III lanthionine synthetase LanKC [Nocardia sp. XZ_19_369]